MAGCYLWISFHLLIVFSIARPAPLYQFVIHRVPNHTLPTPTRQDVATTFLSPFHACPPHRSIPRTPSQNHSCRSASVAVPPRPPRIGAPSLPTATPPRPTVSPPPILHPAPSTFIPSPPRPTSSPPSPTRPPESLGRGSVEGWVWGWGFGGRLRRDFEVGPEVELEYVVRGGGIDSRQPGSTVRFPHIHRTFWGSSCPSTLLLLNCGPSWVIHTSHFKLWTATCPSWSVHTSPLELRMPHPWSRSSPGGCGGGGSNTGTCSIGLVQPALGPHPRATCHVLGYGGLEARGEGGTPVLWERWLSACLAFIAPTAMRDGAGGA